jgi:BCD family chlorophyll transporter-like MFS transporter
MSILKNIRLGLLHVAIAITFVAINGVLNRVMIHDLGLLATVVAVLTVLPYLLSPFQVWVGQYSDTHPLAGYRRTPYILLGILICLGGTILTPHAALLMAQNFPLGLGLGVLAFGAWGVGYNLAVVSYLSLASDLSSEEHRSRTIAIMWFMMIVSIIITAIILGRSLEQYSAEQLITVFNRACLAALGIALVGLVGLEPRHQAQTGQSRASQRAAIQAVLGNPQARLFFCYLVLLLVAILGQDILLEPFGAHAFGMSVEATTQLTALWGGTTLIALLLYGFVLSRRMNKKSGATLGGSIAALGLLLIGMSGSLQWEALFTPGIAILGFGTGIATSSNLALMLDMTTAEQAGLFIGAWGVADALSRGLGMLLGGIVRDVITWLSGDAGLGYVTVFFIEAGFLLVALLLLRQIDVARFRSRQPGLVELAALTADAG